MVISDNTNHGFRATSAAITDGPELQTQFK